MVLMLGTVGCGESGPDVDFPDTGIMYLCESGRKIHATYPSSSTAVVEYRDRTLHMTRKKSASGARYVGGGLEWWTKGNWAGYEGTLIRRSKSGSMGEILEQCEQISSGKMAQ